VQSEESET